MKKRPRCNNCIHSGDAFKINGKTHYHCEHPKFTKEDFDKGIFSPWDTLMEFWQTCEDHKISE